MINFSIVTMRRMVRTTSKIILNNKCPLWIQRKALNVLGGYAVLPKPIEINKSKLADLPVWWFNHSGEQSKKIILYFHGGGYSIGSPRSHRDLCAYLALYSGVSVASLAYRLAPEHPFPAAVDDAMTAYHELLSQGFMPEDIVLAGDSAGGGLALTLSINLKQQNLKQVAGLFLISPLINKKRPTNSYVTQYDIDPVINHGWSQQMSENYLGHSDEILNQACLSDKDLSGTAPMLIHVGTDEVLLDDSLLLKQRAMQADVPVKLITFPELWHVFHISPSIFKMARKALQQAGNYISNQLFIK